MTQLFGILKDQKVIILNKYDFDFKTESLNSYIDYWIEMVKNEKEVELGVLFDITNEIVGEWISDSGINGYVMNELEIKLKKENIKVEGL